MTGSILDAQIVAAQAAVRDGGTDGGVHRLVELAAVASDSRAAGVGAMFDNYFGGINSRDFARAVSVFDPAGVLDPNNSDQVGRFSHDVSTTTDGDIVIRSIDTNPSRAAALIVVVTFTSTQAAGYGPAGSTNETCTHRRVQYTLTQTAAGEYRILRGTATHQAC